jgi:hypothetical protein
MAYVAVSTSPIRVRQVDGSVDPGYGVDIGMRPDQGLPPSPGHPSHQPVPGPIDPGYGYPLPPITEYPTPGPVPPGYVSGQPVPPTYPVDPGYGLPAPPHVWPQPPRPEHPDNSLPPVPVRPTHPIYLPPAGPDNSLPLPPGAVWPPLPPELSGEVMVIVWIPGVGWRWTTVDTTLEPTHPIAQPPLYPSHELPAGRPPMPDQGLPPTPAPKT